MRRASVVIAAMLACVAGTASGAMSDWREGVNYTVLAAPQPTTVAAGKVEVREVFWYACSHCYALDPMLEEWNAAKAGYVEFIRVPVVWGGEQRQLAKLFYTLQALKRPELHSQVFDAIHLQRVPLTNRNEMLARALQFGLLSTFGINEQQFDAAYDSMAVANSVQRAEQYTKDAKIGNVPTVIINGKYATSVGAAGGESQLIALINDLAASEKPR